VLNSKFNGMFMSDGLALSPIHCILRRSP